MTVPEEKEADKLLNAQNESTESMLEVVKFMRRAINERLQSDYKQFKTNTGYPQEGLDKRFRELLDMNEYRGGQNLNSSFTKIKAIDDAQEWLADPANARDPRRTETQKNVDRLLKQQGQ